MTPTERQIAVDNRYRSAYVVAMPKEATFIRLEPVLKQKLVHLAETDGRSLSSLIGKIVADWLKAQPAKERDR